MTLPVVVQRPFCKIASQSSIIIYRRSGYLCPFILPYCPLSENSIIIERGIFVGSDSLVAAVRL